METIEAILSRSSVRKYQPEKITEEQKKILVEAALAAPSGGNIQPWHFSVVENTAAIQDMEDYLVGLVLQSGDQLMIDRILSRNKKVFFDAPMLIFISLDKAHPGSALDCGIAAENIVLAAQGIGLGSIILGGPRAAFSSAKKEYYEKLMGIPEGNTFCVAVAVGTPAERPTPHQLDFSKVSYKK